MEIYNKSHYLRCLCLWKQWALHGHMGIVLSPSRPKAMFSFNNCVISRLNNYTNQGAYITV